MGARQVQLENLLVVGVGIVLGMALAYVVNLWLMRHVELPRLPWTYLPMGAALMLVLGELAPACRAARRRHAERVIVANMAKYDSLVCRNSCNEVVPMQMNVFEAKNRLSQLLKSVQAGEDVVIANRGEPVARLVPIHGRGGKAKPAAGDAHDILHWLEEHPLPDYARRTAKDIQAQIKETRASWD